MTFSIVARSSDGLAWGVAVASKFLAVGAVVPAARATVGAIATQSYANVKYRPDGLRMLADGKSAQQTLNTLLAADEGRDQRQAGIVDASGRAATFTGPACHDWAGGIAGNGAAIQGNILVGPQVVDAMQQSWLASDPDAPLARRLLAALRAGNDLLIDLRVDDHVAPCAELERLLDLHHVYFEPPATDALVPMADVTADIDRWLAALGYPDLDAWLGVENFEMRVVDGKIDRYVLDVLERQASGASAP